jgi:uncharacterized protein YdcH (DUF465 family)
LDEAITREGRARLKKIRLAVKDRLAPLMFKKQK